MKSQNQIASRDYQGPRLYLFSLAFSDRFLAGSSELIDKGTNEGFTAQETEGFEF